MSLLFKFRQVVSRGICILVLQKRVFLWTMGMRFKWELDTWNSTKNKTFDVFLGFLGISAHNFVKNHPVFTIKAYFMQNFIEFYGKYFSCRL